MKSEKTVPIAASARKVLRFLKRFRFKSPLLILTHDYPDPDTLASAFALSYLCNHFGIHSRIVYSGVIGRMENRGMVQILKIPVHKVKPADFRRYSYYALLDTQPDFENNCFPNSKKATIVIDQHPSVKKPDADLVIIDPDCGATSVIMAQCLFLAKVKIPERLATALAYGIISDTMNLYRGGRPEIIRIYLDLLPFCDLRALARIQNPTRSRRFFMTLKNAIECAMSRRRLIVSHLGIVENPDLVAQAADFLLTYNNMKWVLCTGRYKHKLHVSLRLTSSNVNAGKILRDVFENQGEAGGHNNIAGGSMVIGERASGEKWTAAEDDLVARLMKRLRVPVKGEFHRPFKDNGIK
jgi:nanoRNase/pAp phosphatase (c-di-AMP/oligoRNAs hydrolase)